MTKRISSAAIQALKEALTNIYWYKSELRSFLSHSVSDSALVSRLNWEEYKRNVVATLVDHLATHEDVFQRDLIRLMDEVSRIDDFSHLARLDGGKQKEQLARSSVKALRKHVEGFKDVKREEEDAEKRRVQAHQRLMNVNAVRERLADLTKEFMQLVGSDNPQKRGYRLEKILREMFLLFDLDPKASFKIVGEQIDGAFTFEGTDYLLEAKWQKKLMDASDLDVLAGKLSRKLDNTLGLFLSIEGFSEDGVKTHSSGRRLMLLMDGSDLMAVLEGRIDLVQLLLRKRRKASETGNIYLRIHEVL